MTRSATNTGLGYSANYTPHPGCQKLNINLSYTLPSTRTGGSYCFYFAVTESKLRAIAFIKNQRAGENQDLLLAQDDPNNPYSFPKVKISNLSGNANEFAEIISGAGHY